MEIHSRMIRSLLSTGIVLALIAALTAAGCLACVKPAASTTIHDCCKKSSSSHCPMPVKTAHQHCVAPVSSIPDANQPVQIASLIVADMPVAIVSAAPVVQTRLAPPGSRPFTPPDLCIANSVLTI